MVRRALHLVLAVVIVLGAIHLFAASHAQQLPWEVLTNKQIVQMVRARVPAEEIVAKIQTSRCHFDTTPSVLQELETQGIPATVIKAMAEAPYGPPSKPKAEVITPPFAPAEAEPVPDEHKHEADEAKVKKIENTNSSTPDTSVTIPQIT